MSNFQKIRSSILLFSVFVLAQTSAENGCKTRDGKLCVFPFIYDGLEYNTCSYADHDRPWCATEVDSNGNYIYGLWGNCKDECTTCKTTMDTTVKSVDCPDGECYVPDPNKPCVFPFEWNGYLYSSCTIEDLRSVLWCGTQNKVTDEVGWGLCSNSCPE